MRCLVLDRDSFQKLLGPLKAGHFLRDCVTSILLNAECWVYLSTILAIVDSRNQHEARYEKLWMWCEEVIASQKALKRDPLAPEEKRSNHSDHLRSLRSFPISSCFSLRSDGHALAPDREKVGYPAEWEV